MQEQTYHQYYNETNESGIIEKTMNAVGLKNDLIKKYGRISGVELGFGFFAPNVASEFLPVYYVKQINIDEPQIITRPKFLRTKESQIRYSSAVGFLMKKIEKDQDPCFEDFLDLYVKCLSSKVASNYINTDEMVTQIRYKNVPTLKEIKIKGVQPSYGLLSQHTYQFNSRNHE